MKQDIILIAHDIRSAYNIGSMFRTCDGAGVKQIILGGYSATPNHPKVAKTSLGAENSVDWKKNKQTWREIEQLKKEGFQIIALETSKKAKNIFEFKPKFPCAIIVGNEVRALSRNVLKRADRIVQIPMQGQKESLNVAIAAGVALYQLKNL